MFSASSVSWSVHVSKSSASASKSHSPRSVEWEGMHISSEPMDPLMLRAITVPSISSVRAVSPLRLSVWFSLPCRTSSPPLMYNCLNVCILCSLNICGSCGRFPTGLSLCGRLLSPCCLPGTPFASPYFSSWNWRILSSISSSRVFSDAPMWMALRARSFLSSCITRHRGIFKNHKLT